LIMGATEFSRIPGVFISQADGEALRDFLATNSTAQAQLAFQSVSFSFTVKESILCEHVGVRIDTDHTTRGDLRITLQAPGGGRSVLQRWSSDDSPGPRDWTYYSVHHFYESSAGTWTISVGDLDARGLGTVKSVSLIISGVPIADNDGDALDDAWEMRRLQTLAQGPLDDPDQDGYANAREQIMGTNPQVSDTPFELDLSRWSSQVLRLSWPSASNRSYEVKVGVDAARLLTLVTNVPGRFPETEWFTPATNPILQFFRVETAPLEPAVR